MASSFTSSFTLLHIGLCGGQINKNDEDADENEDDMTISLLGIFQI